MNTKTLIAICALLMLTIVACQPQDAQNHTNDTGVGTGSIISNISTSQSTDDDMHNNDSDSDDNNQTTDQDTAAPADNIATITVDEGEQINIDTDRLASDPDGDTLTYSFSEPLDENGTWQTQIGDAGTYIANITASDGELSSVSRVRIIVQAVNAPPSISGFTNITVDEGELVSFEPVITDREGDDVDIQYSGWMDSNTRRTTFDDAGEHTVTLTVSDGEHTVTRTATVTVNDVNRAPTIEQIDDLTVTEGEVVELDPEISDPDGDTVSVAYDKLFNQDGVWQTQQGDAASYRVTLTATDGQAETTEEFVVTVEQRNRPPTLEINDTITVDEGDTVELEPQVSDPDNDEVRLSYSGWMDSATRETDFEDSGEYEVTITATDGEDSVQETVTVVVRDVNRPPVFNEDAFE